MDRRQFLFTAGALLARGSVVHPAAKMKMAARRRDKTVQADYTLCVEPTTLEIGRGISVGTLSYNGQIPGPVLRLREGAPVIIDVTNMGPTPDIVHWHGLAIDALNDGACEEDSPMIPSGATLRYEYIPRPAGTRWYQTHATSHDNLQTGTHTGQFGFLLIEDGAGPAATTAKSIWHFITGSQPSSRWRAKCGCNRPIYG